MLASILSVVDDSTGHQPSAPGGPHWDAQAVYRNCPGTACRRPQVEMASATTGLSPSLAEGGSPVMDASIDSLDGTPPLKPYGNWQAMALSARVLPRLPTWENLRSIQNWENCASQEANGEVETSIERMSDQSNDLAPARGPNAAGRGPGCDGCESCTCHRLQAGRFEGQVFQSLKLGRIQGPANHVAAITEYLLKITLCLSVRRWCRTLTQPTRARSTRTCQI